MFSAPRHLLVENEEERVSWFANETGEYCGRGIYFSHLIKYANVPFFLSDVMHVSQSTTKYARYAIAKYTHFVQCSEASPYAYFSSHHELVLPSPAVVV